MSSKILAPDEVIEYVKKVWGSESHCTNELFGTIDGIKQQIASATSEMFFVFFMNDRGDGSVELVKLTCSK